jgi:hypothetical protein
MLLKEIGDFREEVDNNEITENEKTRIKNNTNIKFLITNN